MDQSLSPQNQGHGPQEQFAIHDTVYERAGRNLCNLMVQIHPKIDRTADIHYRLKERFLSTDQRPRSNPKCDPTSVVFPNFE